MKLTNQEIEQYGDEYASKSYSADANPIDYEMLKQPFMDGMKKALDLFAVSGSLLLRSAEICLLEKYSLWLTKNGYMDTDWKDEEPFAIDEFLKSNDR